MRVKQEREATEMQYQIESGDGTVYGIYEAETPEAAFAAMVKDGMGDTETAGTAEDWIITPVDESSEE